ncbi:MAG: hydantoinase/oxoprolinase family protein [Pseudomonadota bacterium]
MTDDALGHASASTSRVVGVDVGGTFTDLVAVDETTGGIRLAKVQSTLDNQAFGVLDALEKSDTDLAETRLIIHGTTTTTNAVLERKLSKTGLITTRGFRDILELGRRTRPQPYGMMGTFTPIIPRNLRMEVTERIDAQGNVVVPLDEGDVIEAVVSLRDAGCEALVIHFLHPYANPAHELRAHEIAAEHWPNAYITMGHALLSESREFERGVTAAVNASVQPLLERYLSRLTDELGRKGYAGDLLVMNGNGGTVSSRLVSREAAKTVMSGPASGVMAAAYTGRRAGLENLITYDMGGTSTDVALIRDARPSVSNEVEIEYAMPIHVPMVDVRTVGAGGGSIAHIDGAGLLQVGPQSAGAVPGPICYGRGGSTPTISDANLILNRLDPAKFISEGSGVSLRDVTTAFEEGLGEKLGLNAIDAAAAVIKVANTKMAGAIRMVSMSLGADPRDFALFAFGGAGPLHATALARELGIPKLLVPARPGITNALGCVVADLRQDYVTTLNQPVDQVDIDDVHRVFANQRRDGEAILARQNVALTSTNYLHSVDMQFIGQTHLLRVPVSGPRPSRDELQGAFERAYAARFRVSLDSIRANLVNVNSSVIGERSAFDLSLLVDHRDRRATVDAAKTGTRVVQFDQGARDTPIYWRDHLPLDAEIVGPAIIEQMDTTVLVEPGDVARGDADGNLIVDVGTGAQ